MTINKISNSNNSSIQAYKEKMELKEERIQEAQNKESANNENSSVKVTLNKERIEEAKNNEKLQATNRQARLDEIAKQIQDNTFKISPEAIANKMLQDKNLMKYLLEN